VRKIDQLTSNGSQLFTLVTDDGIELNCTLRFFPTQNQWILDIVSDNFNVFGITLVNSINILRQYLRIITFGILISGGTGLDPYRIDDFEQGRSNFFLLNETDLVDVEAILDAEV